MRAVIDTVVYVSYLFSHRGAGHWLMSLWRQRRFDVIISDDLHAELVEVLERPEAKPKIVDPQRRIALLRRLRQEAIWTPGLVDAAGATADPDDDMLASAALEADAEFIVTWDKELLNQASYQGVSFVTPDEFIAIVQKSS